METPISISSLNDFIFCPVSIYFHSLDAETNSLIYQDTYQINGKAVHEHSDNATYSTKKNMLQGISVYSSSYNLIGKIDVFDVDEKLLTERKRLIKTVYDGYVFQLYAQYFALTDMGFQVERLRIYSIADNKIYPVALPEHDLPMFENFKVLLGRMNTFNLSDYVPKSREKCENCIYEPLCSFSLMAD